ncbi:peptidase A4 family-domain-containing protein [Xylariaceae sp. FL1019]|nr:peptidase A4 family-domain-containing protein [Xylariaceae sp. FL1019]
MKSFYTILASLASASVATTSATYSSTAHDANGNAVAAITHKLPISMFRSSSASLQKRYTMNGTNIISYSWCGATQVKPPSGTFKDVKSTFKIPSYSTDNVPGGPGPDGPWLLAQWVAIDGLTADSPDCPSFVNAGIGHLKNYQNVTDKVYAFANFYPDPYIYFIDVPAKIGDIVHVKLSIDSNATATSVITNLSQGGSVSTFINGTGAGTLCGGQSVQWVLEDSFSGPSVFPDFTETHFTDCTADTTTGRRVTLRNSTLVYGQNHDGIIACEPTVLHHSSMKMDWVALEGMTV